MDRNVTWLSWQLPHTNTLPTENPLLWLNKAKREGEWILSMCMDEAYRFIIHRLSAVAVTWVALCHPEPLYADEPAQWLTKTHTQKERFIVYIYSSLKKKDKKKDKSLTHVEQIQIDRLAVKPTLTLCVSLFTYQLPTPQAACMSVSQDNTTWRHMFVVMCRCSIRVFSSEKELRSHLVRY